MATESTECRESGLREVLVLVNPRSGLRRSFGSMRRAFDEYWDIPGQALLYQVSQNAADAVAKTMRAVGRGVETIIAVGGDGTISTIGRELVGTSCTLACIPTGSGNGFARHFGIPLEPHKAIRALASGKRRTIDVGVVGGVRFLVTCSMAWDASIVRSFDKSPIRGIVPYIFAGVQEFLGYKPQSVTLTTETGEVLSFDDPMVLTAANLTEFGGGARIAPQAKADDGKLELVVALRQDMPKLIANIGRLFNGTINMLPEVVTRTFSHLTVTRDSAAPIQVDGELMDAPGEVEIYVEPKALTVLVP